MGIILDSFNIAYRDILIESRRAYEIVSTIFFAVSAVILISVAWGTPISITVEEGTASLWIIIFFTSILSFTTSFAREIDRGTIGGLRTLPCSPLAILFGKVMYSTAIMLIVLAVLLPLSIVFLNIQLSINFFDLLLILVVGIVDLSFAGSFVSSITMYSEGKTLLLPFLLFPLCLPVFVPAILSTEKVLNGLSYVEYSGELRLLGAFFVLVLIISIFAFETILEE
ncbi:MAG TPA: heme exporter protein CcmB [Nitrososphaerales archaeon]